LHLVGQRFAESAAKSATVHRDHCHRSLIADYLTLKGVEVIHLIAPGERREHLLRPEARRESATLIYDRQRSGDLLPAS